MRLGSFDHSVNSDGIDPAFHLVVIFIGLLPFYCYGKISFGVQQIKLNVPLYTCCPAAMPH